MQTVLKQQIEFLKQEITTKNTLLENLMLYKKKADCNNVTESVTENETTTLNSSTPSSDLSSEAIANQVVSNIDGPDRNTDTTDNILASSVNIIHPTRFQALINDTDTSFETEFRKANIKIVNT